MACWILIWRNEEYDIEKALNENANITWPQPGDMHSGDVVYFYDPDSDEVVFRATAVDTDLATMDEETMDYVWNVSFYDGANRYVRLRPESVGAEIKVDEDILRSAGVDLTHSCKLTSEQAALFGDDTNDAFAGSRENGEGNKPVNLSQYNKGPAGEHGGGASTPGTQETSQDFFRKNKKAITWIAAAAALVAAGCIVFFGIHIYDPPTCEKAAVCKICGKEIKPALGHDWDDGVVLKEADCESEGLIRYTCKNDPSHVDEKTIPKKGHDWDSGYIVKQATCEKEGIRKLTCKNNSSHTKEVSIPKTDHDWDDGYLIQSPGCETYGIIRYTCRYNSSHVKEVSIKPSGHFWKEATYERPEKCFVCGKTRGERKGIKRDVGIGEELPRKSLSNGGYVYPFKLSRKVSSCREIKFRFRVESSSKVYGKKWKVYLRCNGKWVYEGTVKIKRGKRRSKVIKFSTPASVDAVYIFPAKAPRNSNWTTYYYVDYVQETVD